MSQDDKNIVIFVGMKKMYHLCERWMNVRKTAMRKRGADIRWDGGGGSRGGPGSLASWYHLAQLSYGMAVAEYLGPLLIVQRFITEFMPWTFLPRTCSTSRKGTIDH